MSETSEHDAADPTSDVGPASGLPVLSAEEQRVLGSLLEKEVTVPSTYPMSVNAVRTACNQASSREPVVDYDEATVHRVLRALKEKDLVAVTWQDSGRRTLKYLQTFATRLGLPDDERALLTVLLLRGAQAPGALKVRTDRLHGFADRAEVEVCLARMAAAEPPLVQELPRRAREQDNRWIHLLGPVATTASAPTTGSGDAAPAVDRESVLRDGEEARTARVLDTFAKVAAPYAAIFDGELSGLPFELWLLERVAEEAAGRPVVEVGCGPGHVTAYLDSIGAAAQGLDLSPEMVEQARSRHPQLTFEVGDLRTLMRPATSDGWGAVLGWYSLIYLAESELAAAVAALVRPLAPGGVLVLAMHAGAGILTADTWFDEPVDLEVVLHDPAFVRGVVEAAGLVDVEWYVRGPITQRLETTDRLYVVARKPA